MRTLLFYLGLFAFLPPVIARFKCATLSDSTMVHDTFNEQAQYGSASELKSSLKQPWPLNTINNEQLRVIKYCYSDEWTRNTFHCSRVMPAFTRWANKLGAPASVESGHNLAWKEANDGDPDPSKRKHEYCYNADGTLNPKVESGTLGIYHDANNPGIAAATVGYDVLDNTPNRHQLRLGADVNVDDVTHEIGHVFGMVHEMIRNDRDEYLLYQCKNIVGYPDALERTMKAENLNQQDASARLCDDRAFAMQHDFYGAQYTKDPQGHVHDDGDFDLQSIMLYPSDAYSNSKCWGDMYSCPLLQYVKIRDKNAGVERIPLHVDPSVRDIEWLKKWYPWVGSGSGQII